MTREMLYGIAGALGLVLVAIVLSYNRFVTQRNLIAAAWANIETELRRRYDLIPNLVETVKGYAAHELTVFEHVTRARAQAVAETGSPSQQAAAEQPLVDALRRLLAVSEGYPELKASRHFLELQQELTDTEDRIQAARRLYNANVADYNRRVRSIPSNVIAAVFGFADADYLVIERAIRDQVAQPPSAAFGG